jgi:hypothetical protein
MLASIKKYLSYQCVITNGKRHVNNFSVLGFSARWTCTNKCVKLRIFLARVL